MKSKINFFSGLNYCIFGSNLVIRPNFTLLDWKNTVYDDTIQQIETYVDKRGRKILIHIYQNRTLTLLLYDRTKAAAPYFENPYYDKRTLRGDTYTTNSQVHLEEALTHKNKVFHQPASIQI